MPITNESPTTSEQFEKYSPLIKSLAAISIGAFSDSPVARGIGTGLASSAQDDIRIRQIQAEAQREKNLADIAARQKANKEALSLMWKVGQEMESPVATMKYYDQVGYWDAAGIARPENLGTEEAPLEFDTAKFLDTVNDPVNGYDEITQSVVAGHFANAEYYSSNGKNALAASEYNKGVGAMERPAEKVFWNSDLTAGKFSSEGDAFDAGYVYGSSTEARNVTSTKLFKDTTAPLIAGMNSIATKFHKPGVDWDGNPIVVNEQELFMQGGLMARKVNAWSGLLDSPPIPSQSTPYNEYLSDSYDWEAGMDFVKAYTGPLDFADNGVFKAFIVQNIDTIKATAEKARSLNGGYTSKMPSPETSQPSKQSKLTGDDKAQFDAIKAELAKPESQRNPNLQKAIDDLNSRYDNLQF